MGAGKEHEKVAKEEEEGKGRKLEKRREGRGRKNARPIRLETKEIGLQRILEANDDDDILLECSQFYRGKG